MTTPTCDHTGIGLPGCPACDPRTKSECGPRCTACNKSPCECALDLDAVEARAKAATPLEDTDHSAACECDACERVWAHSASLTHNAFTFMEQDVPALVREVRRLRAENEAVRATWRHMVEHTNDPNTPDEWVAAEARRVFADDGTAGREWREVHEEVRRLREASDAAAQRLNALLDTKDRQLDAMGAENAALRAALADARVSVEMHDHDRGPSKELQALLDRIDALLAGAEVKP